MPTNRAHVTDLHGTAEGYPEDFYDDEPMPTPIAPPQLRQQHGPVLGRSDRASAELADEGSPELTTRSTRDGWDRPGERPSTGSASPRALPGRCGPRCTGSAAASATITARLAAVPRRARRAQARLWPQASCAAAQGIRLLRLFH
ncbi:hypothetical protein MAPG_05583 [Magnaporthiopsis poae ATCC 64411]|uniref:Uncharacterized protein n=1 Tax=Magnaporthiopsis poae (strain ATCC 64411 / 73-15) TaxID=644358 RepID=A0A0C4DZS6_MAGP6|nr:hypothetical protein MAPG_05583 [Magnaporthiopsis poae ATCC 64411]